MARFAKQQDGDLLAYDDTELLSLSEHKGEIKERWAPSCFGLFVLDGSGCFDSSVKEDSWRWRTRS